ncbi:uncharacterized protein TNCV_4129391 [Trichonephila clavipes]|nr:uncharacterized protein TNCV_4129391 [Trichonephila clavipes]
MTTPGSSFTPTPLGHEDNLEVKHHPRANTIQWRPSRFNFPHHEVGGAAGLRGLQEVYFSGSENVEGLMEDINNQDKLLEMPNDIFCAYLKGHLIGRTRDGYKIFGSELVQNIAMDFAQLKATLTENSLVVRVRKDLERLEESQKKELQNLFNSFKGLFSEKPGLTHVLYHESDTGDQLPAVSWSYRYDGVKQSILDYHIEKMLKDVTIIPFQSPYALPVVLCRKNNGLPPDNPKAYRFAVDYRKL